MENNEPTPQAKKSNLDKILGFLKDPESKRAIDTIGKMVRIFSPHPAWKLVGDVAIAGLCIFSVIYCANKGYIERSNVQSLLALIIGAVIGARFKSS